MLKPPIRFWVKGPADFGYSLTRAERMPGRYVAFRLACLALGLATCSPLHASEPSLSLTDLEAMALARNPTLAQAAAAIEASRGKALQAGLYPNPTVGPFADQLGARNAIDERVGGFIEQEIVTAGKLRLSKAKYNQEAYQAELQRQAQELRVLNGIKVGFYRVLAARRLIDVRRSLAENATNALKTTEELVNVGQANKPDLLQAQIEANRARVNLRDAESQHRRDWQRLVTLVGAPELAPTTLAGRLELESAPLEFEPALCRLLQESPELQFAQAEVVRDQISLRREQAEPIPNVLVRGATGYNFETRNETTDVSIGIRLPIFNRNQGTIRQASAELTRAHAEVSRVELSLRRRLADAFHRYDTARESVRDYQESSLPKARQAYELYLDYFRKRRAAWPQVLVAERTYAQFSEDYVSALAELREAEIEIQGLLLVDGLNQPAEPTPQGHLEATPTPR
jgi:cobalt-zinc-cadmium efflux system outer membrane protein